MEIFLRVFVLLQVLLRTLATLQCPNNQHLYSPWPGKDLCCDYCDAGEQMEVRCTINAKTKCKKCGDNEYNPPFTNEKCQDCTVCDISRGSIVLKPCDKTSDALCKCPLGSISANSLHTACSCEKGKQIIGQECVPCPPGYFSIEENSICRPWTNCTAKGEQILEPGTATKNTKCIQQKPVPTQNHQSTFTTKSSDLRMVTANQANASTANLIPIDITTIQGNTVNWGTMPLIVIGVILLSASAGIILLMALQMNHKKRNKRFKSHRCRTPVQEESSSSDPSIDKQYQVQDIA